MNFLVSLYFNILAMMLGLSTVMTTLPMEKSREREREPVFRIAVVLWSISIPVLLMRYPAATTPMLQTAQTLGYALVTALLAVSARFIVHSPVAGRSSFALHERLIIDDSTVWPPQKRQGWIGAERIACTQNSISLIKLPEARLFAHKVMALLTVCGSIATVDQLRIIYLAQWQMHSEFIPGAELLFTAWAMIAYRSRITISFKKGSIYFGGYNLGPAKDVTVVSEANLTNQKTDVKLSSDLLAAEKLRYPTLEESGYGTVASFISPDDAADFARLIQRFLDAKSLDTLPPGGIEGQEGKSS